MRTVEMMMTRMTTILLIYLAYVLNAILSRIFLIEDLEQSVSKDGGSDHGWEPVDFMVDGTALFYSREIFSCTILFGK